MWKSLKFPIFSLGSGIFKMFLDDLKRVYLILKERK